MEEWNVGSRSKGQAARWLDEQRTQQAVGDAREAVGMGRGQRAEALEVALSKVRTCRES